MIISLAFLPPEYAFALAFPADGFDYLLKKGWIFGYDEDKQDG